MPRFICKVQDGDNAYYLEWSTVVDAPVTTGMSLDEFKAYYRDEYGRHSFESPLSDGFEERMKRVEEKGVSARDYKSFDDLIGCNRAGKDETCLSKEQIIEWYCRRAEECSQGLPCPILGQSFKPPDEQAGA